jgi:hypothetical protein
MATPMQFGIAGALIVALCIAAIRLPKPNLASAATAPANIALFLASFLAGSAFMLAGRRAESAWHLKWQAVLALALGIEALFVGFIIARTRNGQWDEPRRFALATGAFLVYAWIGFQTDLNLHGTADLVGHSIIVAVLCATVAVIGMRIKRT